MLPGCFFFFFAWKACASLLATLACAAPTAVARGTHGRTAPTYTSPRIDSFKVIHRGAERAQQVPAERLSHIIPCVTHHGAAGKRPKYLFLLAMVPELEENAGGHGLGRRGPRFSRRGQETRHQGAAAAPSGPRTQDTRTAPLSPSNKPRARPWSRYSASSLPRPVLGPCEDGRRAIGRQIATVSFPRQRGKPACPGMPAPRCDEDRFPSPTAAPAPAASGDLDYLVVSPKSPSRAWGGPGTPCARSHAHLRSGGLRRRSGQLCSASSGQQIQGRQSGQRRGLGGVGGTRKLEVTRTRGSG